MAHRCFLVKNSDESVLSLRRYKSRDYSNGPPASECSASGYGWHTASVVIGRAPTLWDTTIHPGKTFLSIVPLEPWLIDYRWPARCACGYEFTEDDSRIVDQEPIDQEPIFVALDGRAGEWTQATLPIGAMWECRWGWDSWIGPDGKGWMVKLPPGSKYDVWIIDSVATGGGRWTRTGIPPDLVVTPSIASPRYHGFLGSNTAPAPGWLSDPL